MHILAQRVTPAAAGQLTLPVEVRPLAPAGSAMDLPTPPPLPVAAGPAATLAGKGPAAEAALAAAFGAVAASPTPACSIGAAAAAAILLASFAGWQCCQVRAVTGLLVSLNCWMDRGRSMQRTSWTSACPAAVPTAMSCPLYLTSRQARGCLCATDQATCSSRTTRPRAALQDGPRRGSRGQPQGTPTTSAAKPSSPAKQLLVQARRGQCGSCPHLAGSSVPALAAAVSPTGDQQLPVSSRASQASDGTLQAT
jgi:hypothetical protein